MVLLMSKYCANCGQQLEDDAKFCNKCGHVQDDTQSPDVKLQQTPPPTTITNTANVESKPTIIDQDTHANWGKRIMLGICAIILCIVAYGFATGAPGSGRISEDKYVKSVKYGTLEMAPNHEIGKSFDKFFGNGRWKSFLSKDDNERVVEFNGDCRWNNKPAKCTVQFILEDNNSFRLGAVSINDVDLNMIESLAIVKKALMSSTPNVDN
jgi:hypothetical protein